MTAAGWKVVEQQREGRRRFAGDILASRSELGRERRYAIACVLEINDSNVHDSFKRFRNWIRQSKQPSVVELANGSANPPSPMYVASTTGCSLPRSAVEKRLYPARR